MLLILWILSSLESSEERISMMDYNFMSEEDLPWGFV